MSKSPSRKPTRAPGFDYRHPGPYFVTIVEYLRLPRFGNVIDGRMTLNAAGEMILAAWQEVPNHFEVATLDNHVLMPNHFHALLTLPSKNLESNASLSGIIQWFKSVTTTRYGAGVRRLGWQPYSGHLWQGSFHDRIVRSEAEFDRYWRYIDANPALWADDVFHSP
jgi:putative transposase